MFQRVRRRFQFSPDCGKQMELSEIPRVLHAARRQRALCIIYLTFEGAQAID